ncbi:hypothetical protein GW796_05535 [archaeon]|nr:hypothetical protein [archaeon]NCQ51346.1 hypothetical protein [archaeon]NCT58828.1 hypothetical protein [archaeon]
MTTNIYPLQVTLDNILTINSNEDSIVIPYHQNIISHEIIEQNSLEPLIPVGENTEKFSPTIIFGNVIIINS